MTKKQFRKFKKNNGKVFSDKFYKQRRNSGVENFSNPNHSKRIALKRGLKKCIDSWPLLKATGCQGFTIPNHYIGKQLYCELKDMNIPVELVSVKKYKKMMER